MFHVVSSVVCSLRTWQHYQLSYHCPCWQNKSDCYETGLVCGSGMTRNNSLALRMIGEVKTTNGNGVIWIYLSVFITNTPMISFSLLILKSLPGFVTCMQRKKLRNKQKQNNNKKNNNKKKQSHSQTQISV